MLKAIIFDFDGVICESVEVKTEAFRKLFEQYPDKIDEIVNVHIKNGGISRFIKFKWVYEDILKKPLSSEESEYLGRKFSEYAYELVVQSPFVKGALEFLEKYHKSISFFIISGTPEDEMIQIIKVRQLEKYFKGVYGSPRTKGDLSELILKENGFNPTDVLFVGDAINDLHGAQQAGIPFVARVKKGTYNPFINNKVLETIEDISQLETFLLNSSRLTFDFPLTPP